MKGGGNKMENKIIMGILLLGILVVGGYLYTGTGAIVSAQGQSSLDVDPDRVSINVNIEGKGETAIVANNEHNEMLDTLTLNLLKIGIDRDDIQTQGFNIYPEYDWSNGERKDKGFVARESVVIVLDEFNLVSDVVDEVINSGALVSWINFELSEEKQNEFKAEALKKAGEDARKKAEATASGLGKKLGGLVSIQSEDFNYGPVRYFEAAAGAVSDSVVRKAAINLDPTDIKVRASVVVKYKIKKSFL